MIMPSRVEMTDEVKFHNVGGLPQNFLTRTLGEYLGHLSMSLEIENCPVDEPNLQFYRRK